MSTVQSLRKPEAAKTEAMVSIMVCSWRGGDRKCGRSKPGCVLRDPSSVSDSGNDVTLRLTSDEALVLFDWLHRCEDEGHVVQLAHAGERTAFFNLSALLERELVEPFQQNYSELVDQARVRLAGED
jgi:hypothetical protein